MNLTEKTDLAEANYREKLEFFFAENFRDTLLWSHGIEHHRRVWQYSRQLLASLESCQSVNDEDFPVKVLIASYMHDLGLVIDQGPRHGIHSRHFCQKFLSENGIPAANFTDLLDAIEKHDDKSCSRGKEQPLLLDLLSTADDLDALGHIGIYRYTEIYLARRTPYTDLGSMIGDNVSVRFQNLTNRPWFGKALFKTHSKRFRIITDFCDGYIKSQREYSFGKNKPSGYCGIAEVIGMVTAGLIMFGDIFNISESFHDRKILSFFRNLKSEIEEFHGFQKSISSPLGKNLVAEDDNSSDISVR